MRSPTIRASYFCIIFSRGLAKRVRLCYATSATQFYQTLVRYEQGISYLFFLTSGNCVAAIGDTMQRRFFLAFVTVIAVVCGIFGFAACDDGSNDGGGHTHTYATEWSYDETYHWHSCTHDGCDAVSDREAHTFDGNACSVCGYKKAAASSGILDVAGKTCSCPSICATGSMRAA